MAEFFKNPSLLTKERLKTDLRANGIPLPKSDQKKDFYVQLYLQHLSPKKEDAQGKRISDFSSDEEQMPSPESRRKSKFSSKKKPVLFTKETRELPFDVKALSDGDLVRQLKVFGVVPGPITETTRQLYQKKLAKLLATESNSSFSQKSEPQAVNNAEYSDSEEENEEESGEPMEIDEPEEKSSEEESKESEDEQVDAPPYPRGPTRRTVETRTVVRTTRSATRKSLGQQKVQEREKLRDEQPVGRKLAIKKTHSSKGFIASHWKVLLFLHVLVILAAILVYCYMEGNPIKPLISSPKKS